MNLITAIIIKNFEKPPIAGVFQNIPFHWFSAGTRWNKLGVLRIPSDASVVFQSCYVFSILSKQWNTKFWSIKPVKEAYIHKLEEKRVSRLWLEDKVEILKIREKNYWKSSGS